ncbi:TPA: hypothetical protein QDZ34_002435 [Stenotrophomonas maltophilia]|nr:hypothetical protein [Stenotrophomonas maltophilia]HDS1025224.1 hypothetical protein [Stenotrophomonas maltophilia]HDS1030101.1 hypothetical protein [Stenotrophomonas maltophilia]HDS1035076.1 hypothetical protein [Stenotrophomonas maltophilia]
MAFAPTLKTWLLVLPAVAVLGVAGYRVNGHGRAMDDTGASAMTAAAADPGVALEPVVPQALARRLAGFERSAALPSGLPLDIRADIEGDTDLFAYAQRLKVQAEQGNHEARWMLSRVYDYCAQYAVDPGGYRLDNNVLAGLGLSAAPAMVQARERVAQRCGGFVPADKLGPALVFNERRRAALQGNLAAEAALFADGEPLHDNEQYRRDLVERVRVSRDPEAYMAIAPGMGLRAAGDKALTGMVSGEQLSEVAWRVAACELGLPCGPDSVLVNSFCANGGICSPDGTQDFRDFVYDAAVSRQGAGKMNEWIRQLIGKRNGR